MGGRAAQTDPGRSARMPRCDGIRLGCVAPPRALCAGRRRQIAARAEQHLSLGPKGKVRQAENQYARERAGKRGCHRVWTFGGRRPRSHDHEPSQEDAADAGDDTKDSHPPGKRPSRAVSYRAYTMRKRPHRAGCAHTSTGAFCARGVEQWPPVRITLDGNWISTRRQPPSGRGLAWESKILSLTPMRAGAKAPEP